jgi:hypothetical protein
MNDTKESKMNGKHTPGPWYFHEGDSTQTVIVRGPKTSDRFVVVDGTTEQDSADARLIAAAPEAIELLAKAADAMEGEPTAAYVAHVVREIRALLARVDRGEP